MGETLKQQLTIGNLIIGIVITVMTSVGGAYITLREGVLQTQVKLSEHERRIEYIENRQEITDARYIQILKELTEIKLSVKDKKDRE